MDENSMQLLAGVFALVLLAIGAIVMLVRFGGFRGAVFGARIKRTVGEVQYGGGLIGSRLLCVHLLESTDAFRAVGLEILYKSPGNVASQPIAMSKAEAKRLGELLIEAAQ